MVLIVILSNTKEKEDIIKRRKIMAELHNWSIVQGTNNSYYIRGQIFNDPKNRFIDGSLVNTSTLQSVDFVYCTAQTRNTKYILK